MEIAVINKKQISKIEKQGIGINDNAFIENFPEWEIAKEKVFFILQSNQLDFTKLIYRKLTDCFRKVYVYYHNHEITYIKNELLFYWGITENDLVAQVEKNLNHELEKSKVFTDLLQGNTLGFIETEPDIFKSSLIFADNFKKIISSSLGWPVYCAIPVNDFCYLFLPEEKNYFLKWVGTVIITEYQNSEIPVTTEILKISDSGIEVIGKFEKTSKFYQINKPQWIKNMSYPEYFLKLAQHCIIENLAAPTSTVFVKNKF